MPERQKGRSGREPLSAQGVEASVDPESVLRAKYHDYCSARVADVLVALSPDEIYELAQSEARKADQVAPASYEDAVAYATGRVRSQLELPDFATWAVEYGRDPEKFEPLLMGLWESEES